MALIFEKEFSDTTRVTVWEITETEAQLLTLIPTLKLPEQTFLDGIPNRQRRLEWLASRVLIHQTTGLYPGTKYKDNGQPYVLECHENISISHSRNYAAIVLSTDSVPGIDIEQPSPRIVKVADRFLNPEEKAFMDHSKKDDQLGIIWCAKEAVFKKAGQPGLIFRDHILLDPFYPKKSGNLSATVFTGDCREVVELKYLIEKDYYLVWSV